MSDNNEYIWAERYRPKKIDDVVLPSKIKEIARGHISSGRIPNLMFFGGPGVGKTTLAIAMCEEVGCDYIVINASSQNSIDVLRNDVTKFASTMSFSEARKVIILDEADHLTAAFQAGFRHSMEEFAENCTFILTANHPGKLVEAIHSRCGVVEFKISKEDSPALAGLFFKRILTILKDNNVEYDKRVIAELVQKYFPDFRRCLNELQMFAAAGKIDSSILADFDASALGVLVETIKSKKYMDMRKWVAEHSDLDPDRFFSLFYKEATTYLEPQSVPELVLLIGEAYRDSSIVANQEINTACFLTKVMIGGLKWK